MATAYLGIGSNLGDRLKNMRDALLELSSSGLVRIRKVSPVYESEPVGLRDQPDFLNAVAEVETDASPHELLEVLQAVESRLGRRRDVRWGPRTIDIDILFYDDLILKNEALEIPHPRASERRFVLMPLSDIAPDLVHPVLGVEVSKLLEGARGRLRPFGPSADLIPTD